MCNLNPLEDAGYHASLFWSFAVQFFSPQGCSFSFSCQSHTLLLPEYITDSTYTVNNLIKPQCPVHDLDTVALHHGRESGNADRKQAVILINFIRLDAPWCILVEWDFWTVPHLVPYILSFKLLHSLHSGFLKKAHAIKVLLCLASQELLCSLIRQMLLPEGTVVSGVNC